MKQLVYSLFFITAFTFGQEGFIEIEVRDSISLKPSSFDYTVKISDENLYNYGLTEEYSYADNKQKIIDKMDELKYLLNKKAYKFKSLTDSSYEINNSPYINNNGFVLTFKSKEELQKLSEDLKVLDFVEGSVSNVIYENENNSDERLFQKLIAKAKIKAEMIAQLSNLQLGRIIEFKEVKEVDNLSYNLMDLYMNSLAATKMMDKNLQGSKYKAIIVKYIAQ